MGVNASPPCRGRGLQSELCHTGGPREPKMHGARGSKPNSVARNASIGFYLKSGTFFVLATKRKRKKEKEKKRKKRRKEEKERKRKKGKEGGGGRRRKKEEGRISHVAGVMPRRHRALIAVPLHYFYTNIELRYLALRLLLIVAIPGAKSVYARSRICQCQRYQTRKNLLVRKSIIINSLLLLLL